MPSNRFSCRQAAAWGAGQQQVGLGPPPPKATIRSHKGSGSGGGCGAARNGGSSASQQQQQQGPASRSVSSSSSNTSQQPTSKPCMHTSVVPYLDSGKAVVLSHHMSEVHNQVGGQPGCSRGTQSGLVDRQNCGALKAGCLISRRGQFYAATGLHMGLTHRRPAAHKTRCPG